MTEHAGPKKPARTYSKHGYYAGKSASKQAGSRRMDGRTRAAKSMATWKASVIADLGGAEGLSTAKLALIDTAAHTWHQLAHIDAWMARQLSPVNARRRAALPLQDTRNAMAQNLLRTLTQLGLGKQVRSGTIEDLMRGNK